MNTLGIDSHTSLRWATSASLAGSEWRAVGLLSPSERARFDTTMSASARSRLIWGRMLSRELVAEQVGGRESEVTITANCADCGSAHGRPIVTGPGDDARELSLSISGCSGMVVVATSLHRRVGIDVEPRAGSDARLHAIREIAGDSEDPLRHWTRVEAVLKADGRGLRVDPRRVRMDGDRAELDGVNYRLSHPVIDPRFVISVAIGASSLREVAAVPA